MKKQLIKQLEFDIIKFSVNEWNHLHWGKKNEYKKLYRVSINQITHAERLNGIFEVEYLFKFANNPLDIVNCFAMIKILEDLLFVHDEHDKITSMTVKSRFSHTPKDTVTIFIYETDAI